MRLAQIKGMLHKDRILALLSYCQYKPTEETLNMQADKYEADENVHALACTDGNAITGILILKRQHDDSFEILGIAVDPIFRSRGTGKMMIAQASALLSCSALYAETDGDAVEFYRKCGFEIQSLGEKYPGVIRYACRWKKE